MVVEAITLTLPKASNPNEKPSAFWLVNGERSESNIKSGKN